MSGKLSLICMKTDKCCDSCNCIVLKRSSDRKLVNNRRPRVENCCLLLAYWGRLFEMNDVVS